MMKKGIALLIAGMMTISLAACGGTGDGTSNGANDDSNTVTASEVGGGEESSSLDMNQESEMADAADAFQEEAANEDAEVHNSGNGIDLEYDFRHMNDKIYHAHINLTADDEVTEFDEEEPNYVRVENETGNYVADLMLDIEARDAYAQFQESAKTEGEIYEEVSFGKYQGYYSDDDGIYGYILLDDSDETFNVFVRFYIYPFDESDDYISVYESANIQNMLNTIAFHNL